MKPPRIEIIDQDQPSKFATEFNIMHTPNEFVLNLIENIPQMTYVDTTTIDPKTSQPREIKRLQTDYIVQRVVGRYSMSPASFKKLAIVINQNLKKYEDKFGEIAINPPEFMH